MSRPTMLRTIVVVPFRTQTPKVLCPRRRDHLTLRFIVVVGQPFEMVIAYFIKQAFLEQNEATLL